jgi:hypothetical protein
VEPVFGTLINYTGMRKINTRGIESANKVMLMAAMAYNLKKLMRYEIRRGQRLAKDCIALGTKLTDLLYLFFLNFTLKIPT